MERLFDPTTYLPYMEGAIAWLQNEVFTLSALAEIGVLLVAGLVALLIGKRLEDPIDALHDRLVGTALLRTFVRRARPLVFPVLFLVLIWAARGVFEGFELQTQILRIFGALLAAWVFIHIVATVIGNPAWRSLIATVVWGVAAIAILGVLDDVTAALDSVAFNAGQLRLSLLSVAKGIAVFAIVMWLATFISRILEARLDRMRGVTPSARVLIGKTFRIAFISLAILVALTSVGIDLTALAIFSGAVGLGLGFGLQKVVSNFVSGIILLLDRSIKPGDVIEIGDAYGWINKLSARYASIITRDGKEFLIPNEDLITQRVVNWSFSSKAVRIRAPVGISYKSDVHKAIDICIQSAVDCPRVLENPAPRCLLVGFGDSAVELELRFWITDPEDGVRNVTSEVLLNVWDRFHEEGVEIPFPQRDIHIVSADGLTGRRVAIDTIAGEAAAGDD